MLYILVCRCQNSEPRMRTFLRECGYQGWQTIKAVKGKEECLNFLGTLSPDNEEINKLKFYIKRQSSWSVVVGTDGTNYKWADLGHSKLKEKLDAEIVVEDFGK